MKTWLKIVLTLIVVFLILQIPIFNPEENYTDADTDVDITDKYDVPMNVQMDLYGSCYDCHSNYTEDYPWYYNIQPVSWFMNDHIEDGKKALNFSEFAAYPQDTVIEKFKSLHLVMKEHSMPIDSYLWLHDEAKLTDKQYQTIAKWAKDYQKKMEAKTDSVKAN